MSHYCEAALITCEDFRLHQRKDGRNYIAEFIKGEGVDCDLITRGGGIQDIVRAKESGFRDSMLRDIRVSAVLHEIKILYLVNHTDCGAYGGMAFSSGEEEREQHEDDLKGAKEKILAAYPGLDVRLYLSVLERGVADAYRIIKIKV